MKKRALIVVALALLIGELFIAQAVALTVVGGTVEQRADVRATINAAEFPSVEWVESKVGSVRIVIEDSHPPYWMTSLASSDDYLVDVFSATAAGLAWPGNIAIHSVYVPGERTFFREIVSHEWGHQVWFALMYVRGATAEWKILVTEGLIPDPNDWYQNYVESHAEQLRVAAWSPLFYITISPRTKLNKLGNDAVRAFHDKWTSPVTTTTTIPGTTTTTTTLPPTTSTTQPPTTTTTATRGDPFPDVDRSDSELFAAAWWARDSAILFGYQDGYFGPWDTLSCRHAALMIGRAGYAFVPGWVFDYAPVTRGELAEKYPEFQWREARFDEPLLRSQLLRIVWRSFR